jgi:hypothetical protein
VHRDHIWGKRCCGFSQQRGFADACLTADKDDTVADEGRIEDGPHLFGPTHQPASRRCGWPVAFGWVGGTGGDPETSECVNVAVECLNEQLKQAPGRQPGR